MRLPKPSTPVVLWLLCSGAFLGVMVERASTPVLTRDAFISVLVSCGASGRPVQEAVRAMGLSERAWGRTVSRHAADPQVATALEQRLARIPDTSSTLMMR